MRACTTQSRIKNLRDRLELVKLMDLSFQREYNTPSMQAYAEIYKEAAKLMFSEDLNAFDLNQSQAKFKSAMLCAKVILELLVY